MKKLPLHGLVLSGGASSRMGQDKSRLVYGHRTRPEVLRMRDLLRPYCEEIYLACHPEKVQHSFFHPLPDVQALCGPMAALVTAFRFRPHVSWLLLPCDMPVLSEMWLKKLVFSVEKEAQAVCFVKPDGKLQPLPSLWFPSAAPLVFEAFSAGDYSLWRVLRQLSTQKIEVENTLFLQSANTPEEREQLEAALFKLKNASAPRAG